MFITLKFCLVPPKSVYYPQNQFSANQSTEKIYFQNGLQNKEFSHIQVIFVELKWKIYIIWTGFDCKGHWETTHCVALGRKRKLYIARKSSPDCLFVSWINLTVFIGLLSEVRNDVTYWLQSPVYSSRLSPSKRRRKLVRWEI